jgi:hypothetical protein
MMNPHPTRSHRLKGHAEPKACPHCRAAVTSSEIIPVWSPADENGSEHAETGELYTFECGWRAYRVVQGQGKEQLTPFGLAELAR